MKRSARVSRNAHARTHASAHTWSAFPSSKHCTCSVVSQRTWRRTTPKHLLLKRLSWLEASLRFGQSHAAQVLGPSMRAWRSGWRVTHRRPYPYSCSPHPISWNSADTILLLSSDSEVEGRGTRTHSKPPSKRLAKLLADSNGDKPICSQIPLGTKSPLSLLKPQTQDRVISCVCHVVLEDCQAGLTAPSPTKRISRGRNQA